MEGNTLARGEQVRASNVIWATVQTAIKPRAQLQIFCIMLPVKRRRYCNRNEVLMVFVVVL